jgi:hypothetical protein
MLSVYHAEGSANNDSAIALCGNTGNKTTCSRVESIVQASIGIKARKPTAVNA